MCSLRWFRLIWLLGGLAFVLAALREPFCEPRVLRNSGPAGWIEGDFKPDAIYPTTVRGTRPKNVATVGSWIGGDQWQGAAATPWIAAPHGPVRVVVAGYPQVSGCSLRVEFRHTNGTVSRLECPVPNPGESWASWDFYVPFYPIAVTALRLVAEDRNGNTTGWLAFSEPFVSRSAIELASYEGAQVLTTLALALTLVWMPGLLCARAVRSREMRTAIVLGAGPLSLAFAGVLLWWLGGVVRPEYCGPACCWTFWLLVGAGLWRKTPYLEQTDGQQQALALVALCTLAATAKSMYSAGPDGELFRGMISRTLAVGNRGDAGTSFFTSQAIQLHLAPTSAELEKYFTPWTFFSRGPLAGLAAAPIVFATGGRPPAEFAQEFGWEPFDRTGFAAYRITMIALAGLVIFAMFAVLASLVSENWALRGTSLLALCPFITHEMSFTWPKLAATAWLLASFFFAQQRRPLLGGVALGVGYLFHPLTLLWLPWLAIWAAARDGMRWRKVVHKGARFILGAALLIMPWMAATKLPPQLSSTVIPGHTLFMRYFVLADWQPATFETWLHTRWLNFSNTFFPFWLHFANQSLADLNSIYHPIGPLLKFAFSWWNTLPLGLGLVTWLGCIAALVGAFRSFRAAALLLVVAPSLLLTLYWGASPTGLMRECGHPLLVAIIALSVVWLARRPGWLATLAMHRAVPWWQLPETFLMLWLTTLANPIPPTVELRSLDPVWFALNLAALLSAAYLTSRARTILPSSPSPALT